MHRLSVRTGRWRRANPKQIDARTDLGAIGPKRSRGFPASCPDQEAYNPNCAKKVDLGRERNFESSYNAIRKISAGLAPFAFGGYGGFLDPVQRLPDESGSDVHDHLTWG